MGFDCRPILCLLSLFAICGPATAQQSQSYPDGNGGTVTLPMGDLSFADSAVSYDMGDPAPIEPSRDPSGAAGPPDYEDLDAPERFLTLGCGGAVVLRFEDNALIDIKGTDLYVFEVGPDVEATFLAVSANGSDWIEVGDISGGRADIDIGPYVDESASFSHVRLTDDAKDCNGRWPGADIDSVAAIGTAERLVLEGEVLFEFDSAILRDSARNALRETVEALESRQLGALRVVGHTDSRGAADYNRALSEKRAAAVRDWLEQQPAFADVSLSTEGAGESAPAADNATETGRQKNRRVEIIAVPAR